jgi:hypothetical protein
LEILAANPLFIFNSRFLKKLRNDFGKRESALPIDEYLSGLRQEAQFWVASFPAFLLFAFIASTILGNWANQLFTLDFTLRSFLISNYMRPISLLSFVTLAITPLVFYLGIFFESNRSVVWNNMMKWLPIAALSSFILTLIVSLIFSSERADFLLREFLKFRAAPNTLERSLVYWREQGANKYIQQSSTGKIVFLGSSQINKNVDEHLVSQTLGVPVEKDILPALHPMQYLAMVKEVSKRRPATVVCFLSEFDFYREGGVPTNRLRGVTYHLSTVLQIMKTLSLRQVWGSRAQLTDLAFAAICPLWRNREEFRIAIFDMWHRSGDLKADEAGVAEVQIAGLRKSIQSTSYVESNFIAFHVFAKHLIQNGINLLVVEGFSRSDVMDLYSGTYREETRDKLTRMASDLGFTYIPEQEMPIFDFHEFSDGVHLNQNGSSRFSQYIADRLARTKG